MAPAGEGALKVEVRQLRTDNAWLLMGRDSLEKAALRQSR